MENNQLTRYVSDSNLQRHAQLNSDLSSPLFFEPESSPNLAYNELGYYYLKVPECTNYYLYLLSEKILWRCVSLKKYIPDNLNLTNNSRFPRDQVPNLNLDDIVTSVVYLIRFKIN